MQVGVDEAGKGPVLGSMFVAAVRVEPAGLPSAITDSKRLSPPRRAEFDEDIRAVAESISIVEIPVGRIDDPETNMNRLTLDGHRKALSEVSCDGDTCYVDAADTDASRFERRLSGRLSADVRLEATHRADERYPVVSAASIVAKVARDSHVSELATQFGAVGSGYPSDPTTIDFLEAFVEDHGRLPECARESWQTSSDVLARCEQSSLTEY